MLKASGEEYQKYLDAYNIFLREKYRRPYWKDLTFFDFSNHKLLLDGFFQWLANNSKFDFIKQDELLAYINSIKSNTLSKKKIKIYSRLEIDSVAEELLKGNLMVISNGKIYVIFGVDDKKSKRICKVNYNKI